METPLFPGVSAASMATHGHLHGLPAPYLLAAAAAQHHSLNTSPPPHLPPLPTPPSHHPPPPFSHYSNAASALTRLTSSEHISQSVSKSASVTAIAASLVSNAKYSIASLTSNAQLKCNDELQRYNINLLFLSHFNLNKLYFEGIITITDHPLKRIRLKKKALPTLWKPPKIPKRKTARKKSPV